MTLFYPHYIIIILSYLIPYIIILITIKLVGGAIAILKMMEFVNGEDDIPYIMENNPHV